MQRGEERNFVGVLSKLVGRKEKFVFLRDSLGYCPSMLAVEQH